MTPEQVQSARDLLGNPNHTVSSIARLLGVSRATIYKYVPELGKQALSPTPIQPELPTADVDVALTSVAVRPMATPPRTAKCPTCGNLPTNKHELQLHREGLETVWLASDPTRGGQVIERWHCEQCQPHRAELLMCPCGGSVMLSDDLADQASTDTSAVARWLTNHGWIHHAGTWYCGNHTADR